MTTHESNLMVSHKGHYPVPVRVITRWTDDKAEADSWVAEQHMNAAFIFTALRKDGIIGKFKVIGWMRRPLC